MNTVYPNPGARLLRSGVVVFALLVGGLPLAAPAATDGTTLNLSASAERQVENDRMIAVLAIEIRAPEARDAAAEVNQRMQAALQRVEAHADALDYRTLDYSTQAIQDRNDRSQIAAWRVQQSLELESSDFDRLTDLVGILQDDGLAVRQIRFSVAPETREMHREDLINQAMDTWKERARVMARALGASHLRPLEMELIDDRYSGPQPMALRAMTEAAPAPALEAGHSTLSVTVRGQAQAIGTETLRIHSR